MAHNISKLSTTPEERNAERKQQAHLRGICDRDEGLALKDNPFNPAGTTGEFEAWEIGWKEERPLKRYLVFAYNSREAQGGWCDFIADTHELAHAFDMMNAAEGDCGHVLDITTGKMIDQSI